MRSDAAGGHARNQTLTEDERQRVLRERNRALKTTVNPDKIAAAVAAPTILARELVLRGMTVEKAAAKTGIGPHRLQQIAAGTTTPYSFEAQKLAKAFGEPPELLTSPNTTENVGKLRPIV